MKNSNELNNCIKFKCIKVRQPIGDFYIGSIAHADAIKISYSDIRRIVQRDVEKHLGIQRPINEERIKEIKEYVKTIDASFPTSIILAIKSENVLLYDEEKSIMFIRNEEHVAKIIDGQHRIAGLENYSGIFDLNVSIFIDIDIEDQALLFSTINIKQTKVHKSLVYDLSEAAKSRGPEKTCHYIAKVLNKRDDSPFKDKIKILGSVNKEGIETLTQATFIESLLEFISGTQKQAMIDRDILKRIMLGEKIELVRANEQQEKKLIFRNMFIDERDAEIAKIIINYFNAVRNRWPTGWEMPGSILSKALAYKPFMKFLRDIYTAKKMIGKIINTDEFSKIFSVMDIPDEYFESINFSVSAIGESNIYLKLRVESKINLPLIYKIEEAVTSGQITEPFSTKDIKDWIIKYSITKVDGSSYTDNYINSLLSNSTITDRSSISKNAKVLYVVKSGVDQLYSFRD